jgi:hypothetical protein
VLLQYGYIDGAEDYQRRVRFLSRPSLITAEITGVYALHPENVERLAKGSG